MAEKTKPHRPPAKRKSPIQARSRKRRRQILESTRQLLKTRGIGAVTTAAIARQAGIPVGSVYQYFPNKAAVLVALYEDYLANIRAVYDRFDESAAPGLDWRDALDRLSREILRSEDGDEMVEELEKAVWLYRELKDVDVRHRDETAERLALLLRKLGSRWQIQRLKRLVHFMYAMNNGVWAYRGEFKPPKRELQAWRLSVMEAVFSQCFE